MINVTQENGPTITFDDGTHPDVIKSVMQKYASSAPASNTPISNQSTNETSKAPALNQSWWEGYKNRVSQGLHDHLVKPLTEDLLNNAQNFIGAIPSEVGGFLRNTASLNTRNSRNFLAGAAKVPFELIERLERPSQKLLHAVRPDKFDENPDSITPYIDKALGVSDKQAGDSLAQGLGSLLPSLVQPELLEGSVAKIKSLNPFKGRNGGAPIIDSLPSEAEAKAAADSLTEAKAKSQQELGSSNPDSMTYKLNNSIQDLIKIKQDNDAQHFKLGELVHPGEAPVFDEAHLDNVTHHNSELEKSEQDLKDHNNNHANLQNQLAEHDNALNEILRPNDTHDVNISQNLAAKFNAIDSEGAARYRKLENELKDRPVTYLPSTKAITSDINALQLGNEKNPLINLVTSSIPNGTEKTASEILQKAKEFKANRQALISDLRNDPSPFSRQERINLHARTEDLSNNIENMLHETLGDKSSEYKDINNFYRNTIYPMRNNSIYDAVMDKGKLGSNFANDLRAMPFDKQAAQGMELIRGMVKSDPELLLNVIGQRYARNPKNVLNPDSNLQSYINEHSELNARLSARQEAQRAIDQSQLHVNNLKNNHDQAQANYDESIKSAKVIEKERAQQLSEHASQVQGHEKQVKEIHTAIAKNNADIESITQRGKMLEQHIESLREKNAVHMNLKQKLAHEKALRAALKEQETNKLTLKNTLSYLLNNKLKLSKYIGLGSLSFYGLKSYYNND